MFVMFVFCQEWLLYFSLWLLATNIRSPLSKTNPHFSSLCLHGFWKTVSWKPQLRDFKSRRNAASEKNKTQDGIKQHSDVRTSAAPTAQWRGERKDKVYLLQGWQVRLHPGLSSLFNLAGQRSDVLPTPRLPPYLLTHPLWTEWGIKPLAFQTSFLFLPCITMSKDSLEPDLHCK